MTFSHGVTAAPANSPHCQLYQLNTVTYYQLAIQLSKLCGFW